MRWLVFAALATAAAALPSFFHGRRTTVTLQQFGKRGERSQLTDAIGSDVISQRLDHFDAANTDTWKQRYFFDHMYVLENSTANILFIIGEGSPGDSFAVPSSCTYYAEKLSADLYSLEHRFYGASHPTKDTSVDNLKYLSSRQAIEDIAEFIRQMNAKKGGDQKWILIGGSYAGSLSAWARLKHPELVHGSIASSAPLLAQFEFHGYFKVVDDDFKKQGGGVCYDQISAAFDSAQRLLQSEEGREKLTDIFEISPPLSEFDTVTSYDADMFFIYLILPFGVAAQHNNPPIETLCETFTSHGPDYDPLRALKLLINDEVNANFTQSVVDLSGTEFVGDISMRLWIYQTCTEFGFFQSTNRGSIVFGQTQSSNSYIEYCVRLFGIDADHILAGITSTNEYYGERDYFEGTNVIFSHGTQDPWSLLAKTSDPKHWSVVIVEVEGGAHCDDIGPSCLTPDAKCTDNASSFSQNNQIVDIVDSVGKRPQLYNASVRSVLQVNDNSPDPAILQKLRPKRAIEKCETNRRIDFSTWNKFKGINSQLTPPCEERWFYNFEYGSSDGPNFLKIGGESAEEGTWIYFEKGAMVQQAKEVGANLFALEHRYYGKSKLGTNDMQYLTSAQQLYDIASFIRTQQVVYNRTGPWIAYGCSYSGALSAWSREWFPELITGAVSSSGPVLAKTDFYEFLEVAESVYKRYSQKCYERSAEAFESLYKLAHDPEGRAIIQEKFNLSPAWTAANVTIDPYDMYEFFSGITVLYQGTAQTNSVDWSDVKFLCSFFENDTMDSLDALSALRTDKKMYGDRPILSSFEEDVQDVLKNKDFVDGHDPTYSDGALSVYLWTWQTCNEFGYFQTEDYGEGIFGTNFPVSLYVSMCERVFGFGMDRIEAGVARTNYQYGGRRRYNATNVVFVNGNVDPWHALGIVERGNLDDSVVPILINGTSHCADMFWTQAADPPELLQARQTTLENIKKWIASSSTSSSTASTPPVATTKTTTRTTSEVTKDPSSTTTSRASPPASTAKTTTVRVTTTTTTSASLAASSLITTLLLSVVSAAM